LNLDLNPMGDLIVNQKREPKPEEKPKLRNAMSAGTTEEKRGTRRRHRAGQAG